MSRVKTKYIFFVCVLQLVFVDTLCLLLIIYELIGVLSFRLIRHYIIRHAATRGSLISLLYNRIGDVLFIAIIGLLYAYSYYIFLSYENVFLSILILQIKSVSAFSFLWLPDAMEGPTPVSALLHSATLVVSGIIVYTKLICLTFWTNMPLILGILVIVVVNTAHVDGDMKKQAAVSTCSVLCMMWLDVITAVNSAWLLAVCHAAYKSIMFVLLANYLLLNSLQDVRNLYLNLGLTSANVCLVMILFCFGSCQHIYGNCKLGIKVVLLFNNNNCFTLGIILIYFLLNIVSLLWILCILDSYNNNVINNYVRNASLYGLFWCVFSSSLIIFNVTRSIFNILFVYYFILFVSIGLLLIISIVKRIKYLQIISCSIYFCTSLLFFNASGIFILIICKYSGSLNLLRSQILYIVILCLV